MQGIIVLIIIVWVVRRIMQTGKKMADNAPGKAQNPPASNAAKPKPIAPVKSAEKPAEPFDACAPLDESDRAPVALSEGESRRCNHGSLGGSMEVADHQGMGEKFVHAQQQVTTRVKAEVETLVKTQVRVNRADVVDETQAVDEEKAPVAELTAEQMRRAVVMAEILRRPCERRRWSVR